MKTRIFILGANETQTDQAFDAVLKRTFAPVLTGEGAVEYFGSVKEATASVGKAFADSDTVMFFVALHRYGDWKDVLCKAFGIPCVVQETLLLGAQNSAPGLEETDLNFSVCHAGVPENADVFTLADSLYAGFAAKRGKQTVFILPWERERTGVLLTNQVIPYINEKFGQQLTADPIQFYSVESLKEAVLRRNIKIAVAGTKTESLFRRFVSVSPELSDRILTVNKVANRGNTPPGEYMVNLSITAAEFLGVPYGVSMSSAYYTGDDPAAPKTVYLAVTNDEETTLRKLTSFYGESTADFLFRCCRELCALLAQIIDADAGIGEKVTPDKPERKKGKYKGLIALILALILAVGGFGYYYFTKNDYSLRMWLHSYLPFIQLKEEESAAPAPEETQEEETLSEETEAEEESSAPEENSETAGSSDTTQA